MNRLIALSFLLLTFFSCKKNNSDKLDGTWTNKELDYTVTINTIDNKFNGSSKGQNFAGDFSVLKEDNNVTTLSVNGRNVLVVMKSDKDITVTLEEGAKQMPLQKVE